MPDCREAGFGIAGTAGNGIWGKAADDFEFQNSEEIPLAGIWNLKPTSARRTFEAGNIFSQRFAPGHINK